MPPTRLRKILESTPVRVYQASSLGKVSGTVLTGCSSQAHRPARVPQAERTNTWETLGERARGSHLCCFLPCGGTPIRAALVPSQIPGASWMSLERNRTCIIQVLGSQAAPRKANVCSAPSGILSRASSQLRQLFCSYAELWDSMLGRPVLRYISATLSTTQYLKYVSSVSSSLKCGLQYLPC